MKLISTLFIAILLLTSSANAQTFSDDFETYVAGSFLAQSSPVWATWSGPNGGGADDATVSSAMAHSGSNSLFLSSTLTTGGPDDIVLPFGSVLSTGSFTFESWMYVTASKGAYFNYQASTTVGQIWSMDITFETTGDLKFANSGTPLLDVTYPQGVWFDFKMAANLNNSSWDIYIDNALVGSFQNPVFNVASINFYPIENSSFYLDDVSFNHVPYTMPALNGAVMDLNIQDGLATQNREPAVTVRNLGTTAINSFDLTIDYNGTQATQSFTGLNYVSGSANPVTLTQTVSLAGGSIPATIVISNVNGNLSDDDVLDDTAFTSVTAVIPATGKVVVAEEATGTWCQWCPRGAVFMDMMSEKYDDFFAGIAVHNNDPMEVSDYDASLGLYIGGYPSALVDRLPELDPSEIEPDFLTRVQVAPKVFLTNGATYNASTRELRVSIEADWQASVNGGEYKLACVLTEDSVSGTGSGWAQSNAYAGGGSGVMGGFELLANPVPAAQMNYNHVARLIYPNWDGAAAYAATVNSGDIVVNNFTFILPVGWDENEIHIIGMVIYKNGGTTYIDNASTSSIAQAVTNGFIAGVDLTGITNTFSDPAAQISLYPNPTTDQTFVKISLQSASDIILSVYSVDGKLLQTKDYGTLSNGNILPINTKSLANGVYMVEVSVNGKKEMMKLVKQ